MSSSTARLSIHCEQFYPHALADVTIIDRHSDGLLIRGFDNLVLTLTLGLSIVCTCPLD